MKCTQINSTINFKQGGKHVYFFAHLKDSSFCPFKTGTDKSLLEILKEKYRGISEGELHKSLKLFIAQSLGSENAKNKGIRDVRVESVYKNIEIGGWRRPDIMLNFGGRQLVFELQLSTTFISTLVEREVFYRSSKTYIIWIFASFDTRGNWQRLMQKDIYYSHKRNVFVLDDEAQSLTRLKNELVLKCYWQVPEITDGVLKINWCQKMITLDELKFQQETFEAYYYDSDKDFYQQADTKKQAVIDEWEAAKRDRWNIILNRLSREESLPQRTSTPQTTNKKHLLKEILDGKIKLSPLQVDNLWGFCTDSHEIILTPKYTSVKWFKHGVAAVKKKSWGAVDLYGKKIIPFQYEDIEATSKDTFVVKQKGKTGCINKDHVTTIPLKYDILKDSGYGEFYAKKGEKWFRVRQYEKLEIELAFRDILEVTKDMVKASIISNENFRNETWSCFDHRGNALLPFNCSREGIIAIDKIEYINDSQIFIDQEGKFVIPSEEYYQKDQVLEFFRKNLIRGIIHKKMEFGVFVSQNNVPLGLLHKSEIKQEDWVTKKFSEGQLIDVYVKHCDKFSNKVALRLQRKL